MSLVTEQQLAWSLILVIAMGTAGAVCMVSWKSGEVRWAPISDLSRRLLQQPKSPCSPFHGRDNCAHYPPTPTFQEP